VWERIPSLGCSGSSGGTLLNGGALSLMITTSIRHFLTRVGKLATHPAAFVMVLLYALTWLILSPATFGWDGAATVATLFMTFFITRTEHRDTQALHAKIDELLRANGAARSELTQLDEDDVEEIEAHRHRHRQ
jgi:low affinity Fe/Cu permease